MNKIFEDNCKKCFFFLIIFVFQIPQKKSKTITAK